MTDQITRGRLASETNVLTALHLPESARSALRKLGGNYQALHHMAQRFPVTLDEIEATPLTGREKRLCHHRYGKGYIEGVEATLRLLTGETATGMFIAWAEPVEGPAEFAEIEEPVS